MAIEPRPAIIFNFSSVLSGRIDECFSETECSTLPSDSVVSFQETNDVSELQMDLCRWRLRCNHRTQLLEGGPFPEEEGRRKEGKWPQLPSLRFTKKRESANYTYPRLVCVSYLTTCMTPRLLFISYMIPGKFLNFSVPTFLHTWNGGIIIVPTL